MRLNSSTPGCGSLLAVTLAFSFVSTKARAQPTAAGSTESPAAAEPAGSTESPAAAAAPAGSTESPAAAAVPAGSTESPAAATTPAAQDSPGETPSTGGAPAAAEEESFPAAWFRIDSDLGALQLWAGATHMVSDSVGIATDMYVTSGYLGELDIGPSIIAGPFYVTPMLGLQVDWANHRAAAFVPQLYVTGGPDPIYAELWLQNYNYGLFDKSGTSATGGGNSLYGRFFVDYEIGRYLAVGPEVELTLALSSKSKNAAGDSVTSLPVGVNVMLPNYGKGNTFFIFAGYETADTANDAHFAGRLTFVRNF